MRKTIKLSTNYTKGVGFYLGYQDTTIILLVPFISLEIEFVCNKQI
jgi:hypothetical protein